MIYLSIFGISFMIFLFIIYSVSIFPLLPHDSKFINFSFLFQLIQQGAAITVIRPTAYLIFVITVCFVLCHYGERVTIEYEKINISIYRMCWYSMPIGVRKKLPTMMAMSQRPVYLKGFATIQCTHEFFANVILIFDIQFRFT